MAQGARVNRRQWTAEEIEYIRSVYPTTATSKIAAHLECGICRVYAKANAMGLKKTAEFLAGPDSGLLRKGETRPESIATQFKRGQIPANKGMRRPGWAPGRMRETQFQKGARSGSAAGNWRPIGTILTDPEGYLRIKVREAVYGKEATGFGNTGVWPQYHREIWAAAHGPIPPKHVVVFKDGDRQNCTIENLELISRADLARRNVMWNGMPRELAEVIQLSGALKAKLGRLNGTQQA